MKKGIGSEIREQAFRDTKSYYIDAPPRLFSENLISFARKYCGPRLLDVGCATGNYMVELQSKGFHCTGVDVNQRYVSLARKRGLDVHLVKKKFPFEDNSFDSSVVFEVLEHVLDIGTVLKEIRRVTRSTVLITVPNCADLEKMRHDGVVFEHVLDTDHKNFFTPQSLDRTLRDHFPTDRVMIWRGDPISPASFVADAPTRFALRAMRRLRLLKPKYYFRLYAMIILKKTGR
ncbi:MAG TPA: class I SAM-dependent methyltransferase [Bacteroidota bacterium]|nr:class I SAM-dependent methyltransferase [Bacteroidota bacterium]